MQVSPGWKEDVRESTRSRCASATLSVGFGVNTGAVPPGNPLAAHCALQGQKGKEVVLSYRDNQRLHSNETYIVTYSKVTYFDIFGTAHLTNLCVFYETQRKESQHQKCAAYNTADQSMALTPEEPAQIKEEVPKDFPCVNPRDNAVTASP